MAKPDPKQLKKEGEELKALFAKIKKKQHNCAILIAKDGVVIEAHLKKSPEILVKLAKKKGGTAKGAWGTITMDGQVLKLDPINEKVPGSLPKLCKSYLGARGLKNRLEIKEPDEDSSATTPSDNASDSTEETKALKAKLAKLQPSLDLLHKNSDDMSLMNSKQGDALTKLFTHEKALKDILARLEGGTATDKDASAGEETLKLIEPLVQTLIKQFHEMETNVKKMKDKMAEDLKLVETYNKRFEDVSASIFTVKTSASDLEDTYDSAKKDMKSLLEAEKAYKAAMGNLTSGIITDTEKSTIEKLLGLMEVLSKKLYDQYSAMVAANNKRSRDQADGLKKAKEYKAKMAKLKASLDLVEKHSEAISNYSDDLKEKVNRLENLTLKTNVAIDLMAEGSASEDDILTAEVGLEQLVPLLDELVLAAREIKAENDDANIDVDPDKKQKNIMAQWLKRNTQDINMVLKDKKSKHNKSMLKWIAAYNKLLKANRTKDAQQALDEVALVIKAYVKDFKLSEKQRKDIMKRLEAVKKKMLKHSSYLPKVDIHTDF